MMNLDLARNLVKAQNDFVISSRMCHWNVRGLHFYAYHTLFERVYNTVSDRVDTTVEVLSGLEYIPSFREFSGPDAALLTSSPEALVAFLQEFLALYYAALLALRDDVEGKPVYIGLINHIEELMQDCTTLMYLLSSSRE